MHSLNKVVAAFVPHNTYKQPAYNSVYPTLMQWLVKQHRDGHRLSMAATNGQANKLMEDWFKYERRRYAQSK